MSPWSHVDVHHEESFPRVSGDEPLCFCHEGHTVEFSPRERG